MEACYRGLTANARLLSLSNSALGRPWITNSNVSVRTEQVSSVGWGKQAVKLYNQF